MASLRDALIGAVATALAAASYTVAGVPTTKPASLTVHRMRKLPIQGDSLPAQVVYLGEETITNDGSGRVQRELQFFVESRVTHPSTDGDTALDPLVKWAVLALRYDYTLGGRCSDILEVRTGWDQEEEAAAFAAAVTEFRAIYFTHDVDQGQA
jgi:hypothetical protein